jgi:deaminated glutathione amidase
MKSPLKVCLLPMASTDNVEANVQTILTTLNSLSGPTDVVLLPENSLYFNFQKNLDISHLVSEDAKVLLPLKNWARTHGSWIHLGGVPFKTASGIANTSLLISPDGQLQQPYHKIHLFDVDIPGRVVRESDNFVAGESPAIIEINGWKIGLSICYDLRFSELFVHYHRENVDVVVVPSSFLVETGRAHWQTLLRARAIETQAYVLAPAQMGEHHSSLGQNLPTKTTWGESLAIGPWGEILARSASYDDKIDAALDYAPLTLELKPEPLDKVRGQMPTLSHRKLHTK